MCIIRRAARLTPGATARCCAVGSARGLGPRGRRFESCHLDHVGAKSALLRRLFLPAAQKAAGCVAPLLLLPAKSHAAPSLFAYKCAHNAAACYQLFSEKVPSFENTAPNSRASPRRWSRAFLPALGLNRRIAAFRSKSGVLKTPEPPLPTQGPTPFPRPLFDSEKDTIYFS